MAGVLIIPIGSLGQNLIWVSTCNNWAEGTTIEPTANQGPEVFPPN